MSKLPEYYKHTNNKYYKTCSRTYKKLLALNEVRPEFLEEYNINKTQPIDKQPIIEEEEVKPIQIETPPIRKELIEKTIPTILPMARDIPNDLTDKQVDKLLKKMLYDKLIKSPKKKPKPKKKKKKIVYESSSEESSSESD